MLRRIVPSAVFAATLTMAVSAVQAQQFGSAPSLALVGKTVSVSGGGVAAGSVVSVRVTSPSGVVTVLATVADAKGNFSQGVTAGAAGPHRVELLGANNQRFADLRMSAVPGQ